MKKVKKTVVPDNPRLDNQSQTKPLSGLKKLIQNIGKQESSDSEDRKDFVQDIIGINEIYDGFFFMKSGQVIGIVEVIPLNYHQRTNTEKHIIINYFIKFLRIANDTMHYKVRTEKADVNQIITNILKSNVNEKDPRVIAQMEDNIQNIKGLQSKETYTKKFYVIFEYEGDADGKISNDKDEIIQTMMETRWTIISQFKTIGNVVVMPSTERDVLVQPLEAVYRHFNPKSSRKEPFEARLMRLLHDEEKYNNTHNDKRSISGSDYVAPRGIRLLKKNKNILVMDGVYHSYLTLKHNAYPTGDPGVSPGWIVDLLEEYDDIDIDLITKRMPRDFTIGMLKQSKKLTTNFASQAKDNPDKQEELLAKANNTAYVIRNMKENDEDLHKAMTIITVRANSVKQLKMRINSINKKLAQTSIYTSSSYRTRVSFLKMTMPFLYIDNLLFNKYSHDILTSGLASFYWYSTYQLFDDKGYVLGINISNSTMVAINNFLKKYVNPHILLLGTSGAGKTFTEQMLGYRMRLTGKKCIFIIPAKGTLDYKKGCDNIGGSFISLGPGMKDCINIMEIRPQATVKTDRTSLLARKINSLIHFVEIRLGKELTSDESAALNVTLTKLYETFDITDDNDSIYRDGSNELKEMPLLVDFYNYTVGDPLLERVAKALYPFVKGNCSNMNNQTNVDLDNGYIVFDVDEDSMTKEEFMSFLYIAYDVACTIAKRSVKEYVSIFFDEVWKIMKYKKTAELIEAMILLLRAYNSCAVIATQNIDHFLDTTGNFGKSVLTNTAIRILLKLSDIEADTVAQYIKMSEADRLALQSFETGNGMIIANNDKVKVYFKASEKELSVFTPDDVD